MLLTATGHVLMSDTSVPWWALTAAFAATGGAAWWLADRERGPVGVTAATVAAQAALHTCFSLAQGAAWAPGSWLSYLTGGASGPTTATTPGTATPTAHTSHTVLGHDHMAHATMGHATMGRDPMGYDPVGHTSMGGGPIDLTPMSGHDMADMSASGMLAAHLFAALVCGLWLAHGERAAFRVLRALAAVLLAPLSLVLRLPTPPHRPRIRARRQERARRLRQLLLAHVLTSRGPPPVAAAL
ncbi:hypothetical protein [Streptomyces sp. NPDC058579]|uniref:hypothetical protein n=1 Tax=Streptomyces sp. NPDC058579 TaxID=3346548 RepID=UPI00365C2DE6